MAIITYDEFGASYDDALYGFDGAPAVEPSPEIERRPRYWIGRSSKERPKIPDYISVTIRSGIASLNGDTSQNEVELMKFNGETPEPTVYSRPTRIQSKEFPLEVEGTLIKEEHFEVSCAPWIASEEENLITLRLVLADDHFEQSQAES
ncbi:MAG: hypothetical protein E6R04_01850 [Spirochaetes bacterium]|nr:MAG: hypothetical protein E6R04_01850 [Spirochaetota bacterium]